MNDGIAELQAGGIAIVNNSADFIFEDGDELGEFHDVLLGAVNGGGEMAVQSASGFQDLFFLGIVDEQSFGAENFVGKIGAGEERCYIRLEQRGACLKGRAGIGRFFFGDQVDV